VSGAPARASAWESGGQPEPAVGFVEGPAVSQPVPGLAVGVGSPQPLRKRRPVLGEVGLLDAYDDESGALEPFFACVVLTVLLAVSVSVFSCGPPARAVVLDGQGCLHIEQVRYSKELSGAVEHCSIRQ
jgi:hypothetical protein